MSITEFVIKRKTFVSMLFVALVLLGLVSYKQLPVELFPNAELPFLIVQARSQLDMDPSYIETQAIVPLEGAVSSLQGIDRIESYVERNGGMIYVYFNQNVNTKYAFLRLDEKINAIRADLDEFQVAVIKIDTEQLSNQFMSLQVRGSGGLDRVREVTDQKVAQELENVDGVAGVQVFGGREKSIEVILNKDACRAFGITPTRIRTLIAQNAQNKTFVGKAYDSKRYYFVNFVADYVDVHQLENIVVNDAGPVLLKDVATVYFGVRDQTSFSRVNGKDAVTVQLSRDSQANLIDVAHKTRSVIASLNEKLKPLEVEIVIQSDSAEQIEENIDMIIQLALFGGLLAVFVLWIFLRNIRWVMIITLALPISIFSAFNIFYAGKISINSLTLVGMALAVGMLLDNSVVVMENIYRLLSKGRANETAVIQGTQEVWRSILAATLTTITVFLPFIFAENFIIRLLGRHIGMSIISTLLVSLAVALLLIPMATYSLLRRSRIGVIPSFQKVSQKNRLLQVYNVILKSSMRYPARTIIGAVVLFFFSLFIALAVSVNVPEEVELREFSIYLTMSSGATLERTDLVVQDIEEALEDLKEKEQVVSMIYEEDAVVTVQLVEDFEKIDGRTLVQIKEDVNDRIENIRGGEIDFEPPASSQRFRGGGGGRNPGGSIERMLGIGAASESIIIKGGDFEMMRNLADDISDYLDDLDTIQRANVSAASNRPQVSLYFDMMMLNNYDITLQDVAGELSSFRSEINTQLSFKQGTEEYDIVIRSDSLEDKTLDDLKTLDVQSSASGESYQLQDISNIILSDGLAMINRVNQEKQIEVNYSFVSEITDSRDLLDAARLEIDELISSLTLPSGIAVEVVHDDTDLSDFYFLIGAAFILIFMILAAVFESLSTPLVMMFTIPLAAIGSLWALVLTGNSLLNANTLIGFLILLGIVVNNGIIYIDYTRILRARGFRRPRALMLAGHARVRPILITAITTIIAMIPLAMGTAEYVAKIGAPFAITVIGGLFLSTLFTLVFIPTFFSGLENAMAWFRDLPWRLKTAQFAAWVLLLFLVTSKVDSALWKMVDILLVTILVPGTTYFLLTSLRRASTTIISPDEPLTITIRRLVKVYDESSRFVREWKKGTAIRRRAGMEKSYRTMKDFDDLIWQIPLFGFLFYFTYIYLSSFFWSFVFSHVVYFVLLYLIEPFRVFARQNKSRWYGVINKSRKIIFWGIPLFNLAWFYLRWGKLGSVIFIAVLWYFALAVYTTSNRLHNENINIARVSGRFAGTRRAFYRFVQVIPVIGRKRVPFRALDGVSLEIGNGMFGLLGPNGAGKTTLMRIICGIFDQSRGKIWINGRDISTYREELQGLIGYLPQEFGMYENMSAYEFLDYQAMLKGLKDAKERKQRIQQVLASVHMDERQHDKIGSFSGGMKQRIGIAQTLLHLPRILVVDEPTAGLDPRERIRFRNLLVELSRERIVIFSTHIIEDISSSCNRVAVLNNGKLKYLGEPNEMAKLATDRVWQFLVDADKFGKVQEQYMVVHHMRVGDQIRVRCISEKKPSDDAIKVNPTLEDAYLWLLRK